MLLRSIAAAVVSLSMGGVAGAATFQVQVFSFGFNPKHLTIQSGDTVVWTNLGGGHNIVADDNSFTNGAVSSSAWTFSRTFTSAGRIGYFCSPHGGPNGEGMSGTITVPGAPSFAINYGIGGTWHNPATPGQGFLLEVVPALNSLALGWFTWGNTTGDHFWLSGFGPISGDSASVNLTRSANGLFNNAAPVSNTPAGTATFRFTDCSHGTVTFQRTDSGESGTIPIERLTPTPSACTSPASE